MEGRGRDPLSLQLEKIKLWYWRSAEERKRKKQREAERSKEENWYIDSKIHQFCVKQQKLQKYMYRINILFSAARMSISKQPTAVATVSINSTSPNVTL